MESTLVSATINGQKFLVEDGKFPLQYGIYKRLTEAMTENSLPMNTLLIYKRKMEALYFFEVAKDIVLSPGVSIPVKPGTIIEEKVVYVNEGLCRFPTTMEVFTYLNSYGV